MAALNPLRHPRWRVAGLEVVIDKNPGLWNLFCSSIWSLIDTLHPEWRAIVKPEIVGSFAFMFSGPWSDIDINLACDSWRDLHRLDYNRRDNVFVSKLQEIQLKLGVTIQVSCGTISVDSVDAPSNLSGKYPVYSLLTQSFRNKADYQVFPHTLKWDKPTQWWEVKPAKVKNISYTNDPYTKDIPHFKETYGEYYLDLEAYASKSNVEV